MTRSTGVVLRPDYSAVARNAGRPFLHAVAAQAMGVALKQYPKDILREIAPRDEDAALVLKAATAPASMDDSDWAAALVAQGVVEYVDTLKGASAGVAAQSRGIQFRFDRVGSINVSSLVASAAYADFVKSGDPIPVRQFSVGGSLLVPRAMKTIVVFSREIFSHSLPNILTLISTALSDSFALAIDAKMFDAVAEDDTRVAGLRNGIAAEAESGSAVRSEAMAADLATVIGNVSAAAGNGAIILIASPKQAAALKLQRASNLDGIEIMSSSGIADRSLIAIAASCLVSAIGPAVRFETSDQAALHMNDVPTQIGQTGAPNQMAAGTISLFQSDSISLRVVWPMSWGLRATSGLSWVENVLW